MHALKDLRNSENERQRTFYYLLRSAAIRGHETTMRLLLEQEHIIVDLSCHTEVGRQSHERDIFAFFSVNIRSVGKDSISCDSAHELPDRASAYHSRKEIRHKLREAQSSHI